MSNFIAMPLCVKMTILKHDCLDLYEIVTLYNNPFVTYHKVTKSIVHC